MKRRFGHQQFPGGLQRDGDFREYAVGVGNFMHYRKR